MAAIEPLGKQLKDGHDGDIAATIQAAKVECKLDAIIKLLNPDD